ncbi:MAG: molybdopterin-dependent oxidoreductase [Ignavibacteriaceae bacterium]|nr:molybdopterin-dependent oxidoreductase [Ignavibacteriaceae bacterium]
MKNYDYEKHVKGESQFVDDLLTPAGLLYVHIFTASVAHAEILKLDYSEALKSRGVVDIITAQNIPGENQIGGIIQDEPLLADNEVHFIGQPVAIVVADTVLHAKEASGKIIIEYKNLPVITDPRLAFQKGELIMPPRLFACGDVDNTWSLCDHIIEGTTESGGQEHLYLETQGAFAYPLESGGIKIVSSTQGPTQVQRAAAKVLGFPMNKVEVDVTRIGGGFGGKEDQANAWGAIAALAAWKVKKPVKVILSRQDDMRMTGKRHPYSSDFKIGLSKEGKILAYQATFYQNAGAAADLSPAVLDRTLFHAVNSYYIPNVSVTAISCKTNLPPNTAFRGFGGPQGMFVIEAALFKAAEIMGVDYHKLQELNLMEEGDSFHYGQKIENSTIKRCWDETIKKYDVDSIQKRVDEFNKNNKLYKKGFALMPVCFGISFTNTFMNQASALVHVFSDGSISVSTGAIEMGQGVNMKIRQTVASVFSVNIDRVKIETTNTTRTANTSPTAASAGADMNGKAAEIASRNILDKLIKVACDKLNTKDPSLITLKNETVFCNNKPELSWNQLVQVAFNTRTNLSSHAQYAVPDIYFDKDTNTGKPFAYYAIGSAVVEVTLDCLRGLYEFDSVKVVHDYGKSFSYVVDRGQTEGAIMQGLGWMTIEEVIYNENGKLLTDALSTYKVPDIHFTPKEIKIEFLETVENGAGLKGSKAIGEPPLMYGIAAFFAILNAMKAFNPHKEYKLSSPITPEKVLCEMYSENVTVPA